MGEDNWFDTLINDPEFKANLLKLGEFEDYIIIVLFLLE